MVNGEWLRSVVVICSNVCVSFTQTHTRTPSASSGLMKINDMIDTVRLDRQSSCDECMLFLHAQPPHHNNASIQCCSSLTPAKTENERERAQQKTHFIGGIATAATTTVLKSYFIINKTKMRSMCIELFYVFGMPYTSNPHAVFFLLSTHSLP